MNPLYSRSNLRILWVDDHPDNNTALAADIERRGVQVSYALTTGLALTLMERNKYLAVISDVGRKEGAREGFHLLDVMRSRGDDTPFFFFANLDAQSLREEALLHNAQGSTNNSTQLLAYIDQVLEDHLQATTGNA